MSGQYNQIALICAGIALKASRPVMEIYRQEFSARAKADGTPVTDADLAADSIIHEALVRLWPDIPVVSEERYQESALQLERFFLVDPVDGTREFLNRTGEFTINIALIEKGRATAGVIYAPAIEALFLGGETAFACHAIKSSDTIDQAQLSQISVRRADPGHMIGLASLSHGDQTTDSFIDRVGPCTIKKAGSSLKFCLIAKGDADFYPRFGPTMGWDIAAGDAVLTSAGGRVFGESGTAMRYDNRKMRNGPFLAIGDKALSDRMVPDFMTAARNQRRANNDIAG